MYRLKSPSLHEEDEPTIQGMVSETTEMIFSIDEGEDPIGNNLLASPRGIGLSISGEYCH